MTDIHPQSKHVCELLVIGGGINGVGIARDAAGRGLSVILCEKDDLASHTSSASSKLIHGGLRYLEYYEFALVRKALLEREDILRMAPHLVQPLRFIMPYLPGLRPRWMLRLALFLYDHLAPRQLLPGSRSLNLLKDSSKGVLRPDIRQAFEYSDAWVDDARLVVLNAVDAAERGATIWTRTCCEHLAQVNGRWHARLRSVHASGRTELIEVDAALVVNACGAWASQLQVLYDPHPQAKHLRLVKGSHIVVKRLFAHQRAYIFQHHDGRIVFALPYEGEFTLIGTTDLDFQGDLNQPHISAAEVDYLCELASDYFDRPLHAADVCWSFSGVRPLIDEGGHDAKALSRDYVLEMAQTQAPMLHVFGGKITTYRRLAEDAMQILMPVLNATAGNWTRHACLPGGDLFCDQPDNQNVVRFPEFIAMCQHSYPFLDAAIVARMARAYGQRIHRLLAGIRNHHDLGEPIVPGLYPCEIDYLRDTEFAQTAEDILWRRSKLGLHLSDDQHEQVRSWLQQNAAEI